MTHEDFVMEMNEKYPHIKIMSKYKNKASKMNCFCTLCNNEITRRADYLLNENTNMNCPHKSGRSKSHEQYVKEVSIKNPDIEVIGEYIDSYTKIHVKSKKCIHDWHAYPERILQGTGCPYCAGRIIVNGVNDMVTVAPWMVEYLVNKEDAYKYRATSTSYTDFKCIYCGHIKNYQIQNVYYHGFCCPVCSCGISYPNRIGHSLLSFLPVDNYITEYSPEWIGNRRYDNYFEYKGNKYILEMDGGFHYTDNNLSGQSYKEIKEIDETKDILAIKHGIIVIRIDCSKANIIDISNNILNSELSNVFDLSNIDWNEVDKKATSNLLKEICDYYENISIDTVEIAKKFNIGVSTVYTYIKKGVSLGFCTYNKEKVEQLRREKISKYASNKYTEPVDVYLNNQKIYTFENIFICEKQLNLIYPNKNFKRRDIRRCCLGKGKKHRGLIFVYSNGIKEGIM